MNNLKVFIYCKFGVYERRWKRQDNRIKKEINTAIEVLCDMSSESRMKVIQAALTHEEMLEAKYLIVLPKLQKAYSTLFTVGLTQCQKEWREIWKGLRASDPMFMNDFLGSKHRPEICRMARNMAECSSWSDMDDDRRLLPW